MDELAIRNDHVVALTQENGLSELIKPLIKEIHLFDTYIAGVSHLQDKTILSEIKKGDKLTLCRENNKFDDKAIMILSHKNKKLGYVPEKDNIVFSRLMDAGKCLAAYITDIKDRSEHYKQISISIFLVDF